MNHYAIKRSRVTGWWQVHESHTGDSHLFKTWHDALAYVNLGLSLTRKDFIDAAARASVYQAAIRNLGNTYGYHGLNLLAFRNGMSSGIYSRELVATVTARAKELARQIVPETEPWAAYMHALQNGYFK